MRHMAILLGVMLLVSGCENEYIKKRDASLLQDVIADTSRSEADRARDARSRPDVTLAMLDIGPGDIVFDVFAGGGYYSELIARLVGTSGKVFLHNNQAYRNFVQGALKQRMKTNQLDQLHQHDREVDELDLPSNSVDAALIIMSYHDLFYDGPEVGWPQIDHQNFMQQIYDGLKVGGRLLIVDHQAREGRAAFDAKTLHRIEKKYAIERIEKIGFKLLTESTVLSNHDDDKETSVFAPENRGKTDRFIVVFEK